MTTLNARHVGGAVLFAIGLLLLGAAMAPLLSWAFAEASAAGGAVGIIGLAWDVFLANVVRFLAGLAAAVMIIVGARLMAREEARENRLERERLRARLNA